MGTRIAHVTHSLSREAGGLSESVRHLSLHLAGLPGVEVGAFGLRDLHTSTDLAGWLPLCAEAFQTKGPVFFGYAPGMRKRLVSFSPEIVHLHGLWKYPSLAVNSWSRTTGRPYIISPHGMLEPWSLRQSTLKKRLANIVYQGRCLRRAVCLRATSQMEAESIRKAGYRNPVAVIPNGVDLPIGVTHLRDARTKPRTALFLSRIHPKKGLLNLIEAWAQVRPSGWRLEIAGPDECNHLGEVRRAVVRARLENEVAFLGEVYGEAKFKLYANSDLFLLPTFSENFGLVVAEALGSGVPVITTKAAPWEQLETHRCGWWIEVGVPPLVRALEEVVRLPTVTLREYGHRGVELVRASYSWPAIAEKMYAVVEWALHRTARPDTVVFD